MSYIPYQNRLAQKLTTQGDGTGVSAQNKAGVSITGATTASPVVCTAASHGYVTGDWIFIDGATGTTEINGLREVVKIDANTFSLLDENGDAVNSAGTFGGTVDSNPAFLIKPGAGEVFELTGLHVMAADNAAWVLGGFLGLAALTNGIMVKVYDGNAETFYDLLAEPIKGWHDWGYVAGAQLSQWATGVSNNYEVYVDWDLTEHAPKEHRTSIKLNGDNGDFLVMYCQDDTDAAAYLTAAVVGIKS